MTFKIVPHTNEPRHIYNNGLKPLISDEHLNKIVAITIKKTTSAIINFLFTCSLYFIIRRTIQLSSYE